MCYNGKCLGCIPVENGCLVLAVISAIVTGLGLLASLISGICLAAGVIYTEQASSNIYDPYDRAAVQSTVGLAGLGVGIIILLATVATFIPFLFSVLLCNGICNVINCMEMTVDSFLVEEKRRPGQVKAYFVYGIVITVLAVIGSIIQLAVSGDPTLGIFGLLGCVIYSLFLVLVHQTYTKLCAGVIFKDHVPLVPGYSH